MKKTNGITLIALIVTIILMLILASVTITVAINGGLFEYAGGAKDSVEIANEKDIVSEAFIWAESNSKTGRVTVSELQKNIPTDADATVMDNGDTIVVKFNKNARYYEIENSGKVQGPIELVKDDYAGDLSKGGAYDGTADKPFKITCIEDLVAFSIMTDTGNTELGLKFNPFTNQYVELTRTLDFKSMFSYNDYTTTIYGDLNTDGKVEDIRTELTKKGEGCIGFTPIGNGNTPFRGSFDGKGNEIKNIYENREGPGGLFVSCQNATILNLSLTGDITATGAAAGFVGGVFGNKLKIVNCYNYVNVTGVNFVGGIAGINEDVTITNCKNHGNIKGFGTSGYGAKGVGGIIGYGGGVIENCYNDGNIEGENYNCGGIIGTSGGSIVNCKNKGIVTSTKSVAGGIVGYVRGRTSVLNCSNETIVKGNNVGGIVGVFYGANITLEYALQIYNCYNNGSVEAKNTGGGILGIQSLTALTIDLDIKNCYSTGKCSGNYFGGIVGKLEASNSKTVATQTIENSYYLENTATKGIYSGTCSEEEDIQVLSDEYMKSEQFLADLNTNSQWGKWKKEEDGYPTLEFED